MFVIFYISFVLFYVVYEYFYVVSAVVIIRSLLTRKLRFLEVKSLRLLFVDGGFLIYFRIV